VSTNKQEHERARALSAYELALASPRDQKEPGSVEWCWQTAFLLQAQWPAVPDTQDRVKTTLDELRAYRAWEKIPSPDAPYGSFDALLQAEIGEDEQSVRIHLATTAERTQRAAMATDPSRLRAHGERTRQAAMATDDGSVADSKISYLPQQWERAAAAGISVYHQRKLDKLARTRPDLLAEVRDGKRSVNGALVAAGLEQPKVAFSVGNPEKIAALLVRRLGEEDAAELAAAILAQLTSGVERSG
jgi:hypothetical protein